MVYNRAFWFSLIMIDSSYSVVYKQNIPTKSRLVYLQKQSQMHLHVIIWWLPHAWMIPLVAGSATSSWANWCQQSGDSKIINMLQKFITVIISVVVDWYASTQQVQCRQLPVWVAQSQLLFQLVQLLLLLMVGRLRYWQEHYNTTMVSKLGNQWW